MVTVLCPCTAPKFLPRIRIGAPTAAIVGVAPEREATGTISSATLALETPLTVTRIGIVGGGVGPRFVHSEIVSVVAVHVMSAGGITVPLQVTALLPCAAPKFSP